MVTRPKIRLLRYLIPVIIVLALLFCFRRCDNQQKQPLPHATMQILSEKVYYV